MKKLLLYLFVTFMFVIFSSTIVFMEVAASKNLGLLNPKLELFIDSNPHFILLVFLFTVPGFYLLGETRKECRKVFGFDPLD